MTRSFHRAFGLVVMLLFSAAGLARIDTYQFSDPQQEDLYHELTQELRCLVCQNQNIADSNAELAKDLRRKTYQMVIKGQDKDQIVDYMVRRYGDFVMYKPPFKTSTLVLWLGPVIILVLGVIVLIRIIRRRPATTEPLLSDEQRERAEKLLEGQDDTSATEDKDKDKDSDGDKE
ncbi:cytochrome c-type biogenesis protein [Thiolapillus brandeum]|uniref:Cytochrome c-type biogenesis protein n=1 Tax=Thiolapillus brandeum TaxID=1076588 RepID=A0A7U6GH08_9GAMM|nr:cytochrome c-type biogenesis protein [Thiolapillus brandeum]BAO43471.1 cytochrome c-type biogenesis protein CcmH [Thiolapillus brandeum]